MKEVKITIKSTQTYGEEKDNTELITLGEYEGDDGFFRISYKDSAATGYEGCTTVLTVEGDDKVSLLRTGKENNSNLIIENGKKHHCVYSMPFGDMMVGVNTKKVVSTLDSDGGNLYLNYTIDINSAYMSDNELFITIEETKNDSEPS